jgi:hypothetical protein
VYFVIGARGFKKMSVLTKIQDYIILVIVAAIVSVLCQRYFPQQSYSVNYADYIRIADYDFLLQLDDSLSQEEVAHLVALYDQEVARVAEQGFLVLDGRNIHSAPENMLIILPKVQGATHD